MPNRRQFLAGSAAVLGLSALPSLPARAEAGAPARLPNIVVILADDLGHGHAAVRQNRS